MIKNYIENANFEDTGFAYTLSLISGKHKMVILYCLMEFETVRFNELKRYLKTISDKTLSMNLKELETDKLIVRTEYPQIPPKVEYALSERGKSLMTVLDQLCVCFGRECIHLMRKLILHPAMLHQPAAFLHTGRSHGKNDSADAKANDFLFCHYLISPFLFETQK